MTDITDLDALTLSKAIKDKTVSCQEVMKAYLDQIKRYNPKINAIISMQSEEKLMKEAQAYDNIESKGWLHGIPIAIKDLSETKNLKTTWGSPLFKDHISTEDSIVSERIKKDGAIIIGKTNTPEFGLGSHTYNPVNGITRNPYNLRKTAGGSSGGTAAALAANLLPVADGSDMMGSLRNPAAYNNIYGFRPTWGLIPNDADGDNFMQTLATSGPMGRNPMDMARLLETMVGPNPLLPLNRIPGDCYTSGLDQTVSSKRIGWIGDWSGYYQYENGIKDLCKNALNQYSKMGVEIEKFIPEFDPKLLWSSWLTLRSWSVSNGMKALFQDRNKRKLLKPEIIYEIESGLALSASQVYEASVVRSNWFKYLRGVFSKFDALALPSAQVFPFDVEQDWPKQINNTEMSTYHQWMEVVIPVSLVGLPSISIPCGFGKQNLPMGLQLFGAQGHDKLMLQFAQNYHQVIDWPNREKPIL